MLSLSDIIVGINLIKSVVPVGQHSMLHVAHLVLHQTSTISLCLILVALTTLQIIGYHDEFRLSKGYY